MGFEPTVPLRVHTPSKRAPSATRSSLPVKTRQPPAARSLKKISRREWDSNPRSRKRLNGFRDRPIRPLSHLSETQDGSRSAPYTEVPEPTGTLARNPTCPRGFEPPAFGSAIQCSIQLSYGHMIAAPAGDSPCRFPAALQLRRVPRKVYGLALGHPRPLLAAFVCPRSPSRSNSAGYRGRFTERGGFEPPVPFRGTTP